MLTFALRHWRLALGFPIATSLLTLFITFLLPEWFEGEASLMPPQQTQGAIASAMYGSLAQSLGLPLGQLGLRNPSDLYVEILKSRTITDRIIERFKLKELYDEDTIVETRKRLESLASIKANREGLILVRVEDKDPQRAADMANAYVEELINVVAELTRSEAAQRRAMFESELIQARKGLGEAERQLQQVQEKTGVVFLDEQGKAILERISRIRAEIISREVELRRMNTFATEQNPRILSLKAELAALKEELSRYEGNNKSKATGDLFVPTGKIPEAGLEYVQKLRDVKYHEALLEVLLKQYEIARMDAIRDVVVMQVLDKAIPADKRSWPKRGLLTAIAGLISLAFTAWAIWYLHLIGAERRERLLAECLRRAPALRRVLSATARA